MTTFYSCSRTYLDRDTFLHFIVPFPHDFIESTNNFSWTGASVSSSIYRSSSRTLCCFTSSRCGWWRASAVSGPYSRSMYLIACLLVLLRPDRFGGSVEGIGEMGRRSEAQPQFSGSPEVTFSGVQDPISMRSREWHLIVLSCTTSPYWLLFEC